MVYMPDLNKAYSAGFSAKNKFKRKRPVFLQAVLINNNFSIPRLRIDFFFS